MKRSLLKNLFLEDSEGTENRSKFIHDRIHIVEKHIPQLNSALNDYIRKNAGLRDYGDKVAIVLENYVKSETVTTGIKQQLNDFANILVDVGSRRDLQIKEMEAKVLDELMEYSKLCKHIRSELKSTILANDREKIRLRQLRRIQENNPQDHQQISLAEAEVIKAKGESARSTKNLEEQTDIFERKKLNSLKDVLMAWTIAELHFHSKALELFSEAYKVAAEIDVESNIEEFRYKLRTVETTPRIDTSFNRSDSIVQLISMPFQRRSASAVLTETGIPHPATPNSSISSVSRSSLSHR